MTVAGFTLEAKAKTLYGNNADLVKKRSKIMSRLNQIETVGTCGGCLVIGTSIAALVKLIQFTIDINDIEETCVVNGDDYDRLNTLKWLFWFLPASISCVCGCCERVLCGSRIERRLRYANRIVDSDARRAMRVIVRTFSRCQLSGPVCTCSET